MSERDAVLLANRAFYEAFAAADADRMAQVWATDRDDLTVVHPGSVAIAGRAGVLGSWRSIFDGAGHVDIRHVEAAAYLHGDMAIVLCTEIIQGQGLAATNIFCRTAPGWRMVHHHAGPCPAPQRDRKPPPVLH